MTTPGLVLVLNAGSSTVKAAVIDPDSGERKVGALVEDVDDSAGAAVRDLLDEWSAGPGLADGLADGLSDGLADVVAVGHRVVHGGPDFVTPVVVDDDVRSRLESLTDLAPLQMPVALSVLDAARERLPDVPHVAVFDTAFHDTLPEFTRRYAVPHRWYADLGVRRYGFHGLSHRYVTSQAAELLGRPVEDLRLVSLHLGSGCSGAAVLGGRSVDTTMGFTPLEGLVMGTRSGDIDPGVLPYVAGKLGVGIEEVVRDLNERSGLLGLSDLSNDCRVLEQAAADGSGQARLALDVFAYRAAKAVAALTVALGGLDALVLTGGIGEHSTRVRSDLLARLAHLGLVEDAGANARHGVGTNGRVSKEGTSPVALVVPTDEELVIARDAVNARRRPGSSRGAGPLG